MTGDHSGHDVVQLNDRPIDPVAGEDRDALENAIAAVEADTGRELTSGRGRAAEGELSLGEVVGELARAYTGWHPEDVDDE